LRLPPEAREEEGKGNRRPHLRQAKLLEQISRQESVETINSPQSQLTTMSTSKLSGQRVLLVGGTGGVGLAVARLLLAQSAKVILSSSRDSKVSQCISTLQSEFKNLPEDHITGYTCDLAAPTVEDNIVGLFKQATSSGPLNHIIYMAGDRLPMLPLEDVTLAAWQKCNQVRTIASILVAKHGVKHLAAGAPSNSITFTGGSISEKPIAGGWSMLALIGSGINGLTRQLAFDLAPVRVNCVALGVIETDLWEGMGEEGKKTFFRDLESKIPTGKVGQPDDVAEAYAYLLKDKNATGMVIHSNSGTFLQ
jgi:NAD(P)-dependent dehydrogenase (short-subunit alcohol dehydrogenase family)